MSIDMIKRLAKQVATNGALSALSGGSTRVLTTVVSAAQSAADVYHTLAAHRRGRWQVATVYSTPLVITSGADWDAARDGRLAIERVCSGAPEQMRHLVARCAAGWAGGEDLLAPLMPGGTLSSHVDEEMATIIAQVRQNLGDDPAAQQDLLRFAQLAARSRATAQK